MGVFKINIKDKRVVILALLLNFILLAFLGYQEIKSDSDMDIESEYVLDVPNGKATFRTIKRAKKRSEMGVNVMEESLMQISNPVIRDSLKKIISSEKKFIEESQYLLDKFLTFPDMEAIDQETFLNRIGYFLDHEKKFKGINFGFVAKDLLAYEQTTIITNLESELKVSNDKVDELLAESLILKTESDKYEKLYTELLVQTKKVYDVLSRLKTDSTVNEGVVYRLEQMVANLESANEKLMEKVSSVSPVKISNVFFKPAETRARPDGSYKQGNVKDAIYLDFVISSNLTLETNKRTIKIVIQSASGQHAQQTKSIEFGERWNREYGKDWIVKQIPDFRFEPGLYAVTIIDLDSENEPIVIGVRNFYLRKWNDPKELSF